MRGDSPVSLRDLPPTVVDLLGLSADAPFPGRSLAAFWGPATGRKPTETATPGFSEQADATALHPEHPIGLANAGVQMSLVASGMHYIRNGRGAEQFYDLRVDPYEQTNLVKPGYETPGVDVFRKMLLKVLDENPGSIEAENAYLKAYRQRLQALVSRSAPLRNGSRIDRQVGQPRRIGSWSSTVFSGLISAQSTMPIRAMPT